MDSVYGYVRGLILNFPGMAEAPKEVLAVQKQVVFLCAMMDALVGSKPSLSYKIKTKKFGFIPICDCPACVLFIEGYKVKYFEDLTEAAEYFFMERSAYMLAAEEAEGIPCVNKH